MSERLAHAASDDDRLLMLQSEAFDYFRHEATPRTGTLPGLVPDSTQERSPCSIAAVGFALTAYVVAAERGLMPRAAVRRRVLASLRFFAGAPQGEQADAAGYRGFFYHFLDRHTGRRTWTCELSSIDTALLIAGVLTAGRYFTGDSPDEREIRELADTLYRRVEWDWMRDSGETLSHGWSPENGFIPYRWTGYSEGLLLYLLALGSPTHAVPPRSYDAWTATYEWRSLYGYEYLHAGPLFIHQMPHCWVDFRGIHDAYMRGKGIDYFENSRRATLVQRAYALENPSGFARYGEGCWGLTACDGPGPAVLRAGGRDVKFYDYIARGVPSGPDDGTVAPWVVLASLPFAPEVVLPTIDCLLRENLGLTSPYGFEGTFNATFPVDGEDSVWISPRHLGINQGPIVVMIENHRTGLIWRLLRGCPYLVTGLRRAGFSGGWLDSSA